MGPRVLLPVVSLVVLAAGTASPFSPGPPRPLPSDVTGVCSDGQPPADPTTSCDVNFNTCNPGATCLASPASVIPGVVVRGTLTIIVDEDVSNWSGGADTSANRADNARLTLLLEFQVGGKPFAVADIFHLDNTSCTVQPGDSSLCVPTWNEPATEKNIIARVGAFQDLQLQWAQVNPQFTSAILNALLTPQQLAQYPNAKPLLEIVDQVATDSETGRPGVVPPNGTGITAATVASLYQFDHSGSDPLASIRRVKVTIRVTTK
jgi:hypothetical protein